MGGEGDLLSLGDIWESKKKISAREQELIVEQRALTNPLIHLDPMKNSRDFALF